MSCNCHQSGLIPSIFDSLWGNFKDCKSILCFYEAASISHNDRWIGPSRFISFFFFERRTPLWFGAKFGVLTLGSGTREVVNNIVDGIHPFWATFKDAVVHTPVSATFREPRVCPSQGWPERSDDRRHARGVSFPNSVFAALPSSLGMLTAVGRMIPTNS